MNRLCATIDSFHGRYRFLSNFSSSEVTLYPDEPTYPTIEHAFQAAKTDSWLEREKIRNARTPGDAKRMGRTATLRKDWNGERDAVMLYLLRQKFDKNGNLAKWLVMTGDALLVEGNTWGDQYWGVCEGVGENRLGELLMQVRSELV